MDYVIVVQRANGELYCVHGDAEGRPFERIGDASEYVEKLRQRYNPGSRFTIEPIHDTRFEGRQ